MLVIAGWNQAGATAWHNQLLARIKHSWYNNLPSAECAMITDVLKTSALAASFALGPLGVWVAA